MAREAATPPTTLDVEEMAGSLRLSIARLARLLRQQDQSGMAPALATALASIGRDGPITLSRLAALEQVTPPTITKLVDKLESRGFIERRIDPNDRRVCRVVITAAGSAQLDAIRERRTEWLSAQLRSLPSDDLARLHDVIEVLDHLVRPPSPPEPNRIES
jgi:DNA-binding MarR family transcriptional regulator